MFIVFITFMFTFEVYVESHFKHNSAHKMCSQTLHLFLTIYTIKDL